MLAPTSLALSRQHPWPYPNILGLIDNSTIFQSQLKAGRDLGNKAIDAATQKVDEVAKSKGFDTSKITSAAVGRAQYALSQAEGHAADLLDCADNKLAGNGMYLEGGHFYNLQGKATQKVNIDILQLYKAVASYR